MTLTSHAVFLTPTDPEAVFGLARRLVGIPEDQPFEVVPDDPRWGKDGRTVIRSQPGGFPAMLWVTLDPHPADGPPCRSEWCAEDGGCSCHPEGYVDVMLDTAYWGGGCGRCLHVEVFRGLREALGGEMVWHDEFWDSWHEQVPTACPEHGGHVDGHPSLDR